ncbi:MAG: NAD(+) synthase [Alistipes sp.]|nr:NAD(+) synthase [Alistipes sp.]
MDFGFLRVAAALPERVKIADARANAGQIAEMIGTAAAEGVRIAVFPELSLTGYTCGDLFRQRKLLDDAEEALADLVEATAALPVAAIVGMPVRVGDRLYNCAVVMGGGCIWGVVPKSYIPNYDEFYELRHFASGLGIGEAVIELAGEEVCFGTDLLFSVDGVEFGVEICEDLWSPVPPSSYLAAAGAKIIFNLSASPEAVGKYDYLRSLVAQQSARLVSAYVYASSGAGESSTDLVFAGNGIVAENGAVMASSERFVRKRRLVAADIDTELLSTRRLTRNTFATSSLPVVRVMRMELPDGCPCHDLHRTIDPAPFVPSDNAMREERCREIFEIQASGLAQRLEHTSCRTAVIGISGGLDSTLALLVTAHAFDILGLDRRGIIGITMPGFGTTDRTYTNALGMIDSLGVTRREISIRKACEQHFSDIGLPDGDRSVTYENSQARERTQILMDVANMLGGMVIGTGDMSELALGWATYNGDHMSMYGVNASVPKTLVRHLVAWYAGSRADEHLRATLGDVLDTPVSPELLPADESGDIAQRTEDLVGPYELHDFFLYAMVRQGFAPSKIAFLAGQAFAGRYDKPTIIKWLRVFVRRFFSQQFKRSAMPDAPKVGSVALSPRGDWRMPSDAEARSWIEEVDALAYDN